MEEKKDKKVKMEVLDNKEVSSKDSKKYTYEELEYVCDNLAKENNELIKQLRYAQAMNASKRLDYLFKIIENSSIIKNSELENMCITEIKESLFGNDSNKEDVK